MSGTKRLTVEIPIALYKAFLKGDHRANSNTDSEAIRSILKDSLRISIPYSVGNGGENTKAKQISQAQSTLT